MAEILAFQIWAEGFCTDADGNLLTPTGELAESAPDDDPEEQS